MTRLLPLARPSRACRFAHIPFAASQAAQVPSDGRGGSCSSAGLSHVSSDVPRSRQSFPLSMNLVAQASRLCVSIRTGETPVPLSLNRPRSFGSGVQCANVFRGHLSPRRNNSVEKLADANRRPFCRAKREISQCGIESLNGERPMNTTKEFLLPEGEG